MSDIYADRPLVEGYPDLDSHAFEAFLKNVRSRPDDGPRIEKVLTYLGRLMGASRMKRMMVLGCGPEPVVIRTLRENGFDVQGVEPVKSFVENANQYLGETIVKAGAAEQIDAPGESQDVVFFESVLEHVDSPQIAMAEICRVLVPGGVVLVITTNRHRFSITGNNGEFNVPFYNWLPPLMKECYVYTHLHHRPEIANYTGRPAVHWFTYAELCRLGREVGFAQFYSVMDLVREADSAVRRSALRRIIFKLTRTNPWFRALVLTQFGGVILMMKRK